MSRKQQRIRRAIRRQQKAAEARALLARIDALVRPLGYRLTGLGPSSVGVQGDARTYGLSVVIRCPTEATMAQIAEVSTLITNHIGEVNRVLMDL